jgi:hypothetical protein
MKDSQTKTGRVLKALNYIVPENKLEKHGMLKNFGNI